MPRRQPSNRIEVDLKLLQDKNAEKLMNFGKQFGQSVDKLALALADWNGQVAAGEGMQRPGESPAASNAKSVDLDTARPAGQQAKPKSKTVGEARGPRGPLPPQEDGINYGWDDRGGSASVAQPLTNDEEQEYVRAMRRIGEVPTTVRQMMGYVAESGKYYGEGDPRNSRDVKGNPLRWWNIGASKASDVMFSTQTVQQGLQRHYTQMNALTGFGQDVGYSREGAAPFGLSPMFAAPFGFMSPAFREGAKSSLKAQWSAKFGLNPNYTVAQAKEARSIVNAFGYGGDRADYMAERLKQLEIHQRLSPEASMRLLDPAARFGNVEMSQLEDTLNGLPAAAKAARMNLKQFGEQVTTLAEQLAANGPGSPTAYAGQLSAFSAVTGLSPEKGAAMLQSKQQTFMAMGMTGMSYAKATIGPNALAGRLKAPMMIGNQLAQSYGFKDMGALSKAYTDIQNGDPVDPAAEQALSALAMMIEAQPDLFGGMNLKELMNNARRGNVLGRTEALSQLNAMGDRTLDDAEARRLIGLSGLGKKGIHGYEVDRKAFEKKLDNQDERKLRVHQKPLSSAERAKAISDHERAYLRSRFGKQSQQRGDKAAGMTIGLSPEAQKYFKLLDKSSGGKGKSNALGDADFYKRQAIAGLDKMLDQFTPWGD